MNKIKLVFMLCFMVFGVAALLFNNGFTPVVQSYSTQPPPQMTGAPGEQNCSLCHDDTGPGIITVFAPANYIPGQTYQIQVQHATTDTTRLRWGFELTTLDGTNSAAGTFTDTTAFTQQDFGDGRWYIEHTQAGTFAGTPNGATWTFDWNAPATDVGPVTFYAAGNQANNNDNPSGDQTYLTTAVSLPLGPTPTNTATETNTPTPTPTCYTVTTLSGSEEVPPNGSTATGTGTVSVNAAQTQITVTLDWSSLSSNATAAHIHGPAAAGSNAGILFGMTGVPLSPTGSVPTQSFAISPAQLTQFQNGLFYWNVHSSTFPGGEIRGQILPGPCLATPTPTATSTLTSTNTPTATATTTPGGSSVSGTVTYGNPASPTTKFISNATVASTVGSPLVTTVTDAPGGTAGQYTLTGFGTGNYTIGVTKTTGQNGVSSADAARIAQHVSGVSLITNDRQRIAADVTNNGALSSTDAAQIARFVSGLGPPIGLAGQWRFFVPSLTEPTFPIGASPTTRSYADPIGVQTGQDYIGILVGEVTGNWNPTAARPFNGRQLAEVEGSGPERGIAVELPSVVGSVDKEIVVPVSVEGISNKGVISYEFDLRYDPSVLQPLVDPVDVSGTVSRGLSVVVNATEPGLMRVVLYGAYPIDGDGVLLNLRFTSVGTVGSVSPISFEQIMFNEGESRVTITNGKIELF
ncbi:MAG: CHRD domain-containing protein [Chloracidobacterium sp.]|nr:CHRD domain-containing protein [Chloracidobacterium sp.]